MDLYLELAARHVERKQAERALRESEERFRAFVAASSDVVYRMSADWSEMRHLVGREFIPDTLEPSRTWLHKYIDPGDQPRVTEAIDHAIRTKSTFELEHRVLRVHSRPDILACHSPDGRPGEIVEWFGTATDITERKHAEEALRESEQRMRDLLATLDLSTVMIRDPEGAIRFWSAGCERLYGWPAAEAVGRSAHELLRTECPAALSEIDSVLEHEREWAGDLLQRRRDGTEIVVAARMALRRDTAGPPPRWKASPMSRGCGRLRPSCVG
jgi:PAS domain S-box-containing protein